MASIIQQEKQRHPSLITKEKVSDVIGFEKTEVVEANMDEASKKAYGLLLQKRIEKKQINDDVREMEIETSDIVETVASTTEINTEQSLNDEAIAALMAGKYSFFLIKIK